MTRPHFVNDQDPSRDPERFLTASEVAEVRQMLADRRRTNLALSELPLPEPEPPAEEAAGG